MWGIRGAARVGSCLNVITGCGLAARRARQCTHQEEPPRGVRSNLPRAVLHCALQPGRAGRGAPCFCAPRMPQPTSWRC